MCEVPANRWALYARCLVLQTGAGHHARRGINPFVSLSQSDKMSNPKFGRRHYEVVAAAIHAARQYEQYEAGSRFIQGYLEFAFESDNPNFDRQKFSTYCDTGHY